MKVGSIVLLTRHREDANEEHHGGKKHFYVTYSSDNKNNGKEIREVTVISSDSCHFRQPGYSDSVMTNCTKMSHNGGCDRRYKVITSDSKDNGDQEEYIYIDKSRDHRKNHEKSFETYGTDDDKDSTVNRTKYVIAKDGMVVTVEGSNEARAKELVKEIEDKLGVRSEEKEKKEVVPTESKKTIKK